MSDFTTADKLKAVKRELALRKNVYPGFITRGKMTMETAHREIALMESIVADYEALAQKEKLI